MKKRIETLKNIKHPNYCKSVCNSRRVSDQKVICVKTKICDDVCEIVDENTTLCQRGHLISKNCKDGTSGLLDNGLSSSNHCYVCKVLVDDKTITCVNEHITCSNCGNNNEGCLICDDHQDKSGNILQLSDDEDFIDSSDDEDLVDEKATTWINDHIRCDNDGDADDEDDDENNIPELCEGRDDDELVMKDHKYMVPCFPCGTPVPFNRLHTHWMMKHKQDVAVNLYPTTGYYFKPYILVGNKCFMLKVIQYAEGYAFIVFHLTAKVNNKNTEKYSYRIKIGTSKDSNAMEGSCLTAEINMSHVPIDVKEVNWTTFSYEKFKLILQEDNRFTYMIAIFEE